MTMSIFRTPRKLPVTNATLSFRVQKVISVT
jgi:hypothetical protein